SKCSRHPGTLAERKPAAPAERSRQKQKLRQTSKPATPALRLRAKDFEASVKFALVLLFVTCAVKTQAGLKSYWPSLRALFPACCYKRGGWEYVAHTPPHVYKLLDLQ